MFYWLLRWAILIFAIIGVVYCVVGMFNAPEFFSEFLAAALSVALLYYLLCFEVLEKTQGRKERHR